METTGFNCAVPIFWIGFGSSTDGLTSDETIGDLTGLTNGEVGAKGLELVSGALIPDNPILGVFSLEPARIPRIGLPPEEPSREGLAPRTEGSGSAAC